MRLTVTILVLVLASVSVSAQEDLWQLYNAGDREGALERATALLEEQPDSRDLHHLAGRALADMGRSEEARAHLEFCVEGEVRDWRYAWSLFYLGAIDAASGDHAAARAKWVEVRDGHITANVSRAGERNLKSFGLDESFDEWIHRESEHLRVQFSPAHAGKDIDRWIEGHEQAWERFVDLFGGEPDAPVRYLVWRDESEAAEMSGIPMLGFAKPEYYLIHCRWEQSVGHELAHVFVGQVLHPTAETRFINEGIAVAHDFTHRDRMDTAREAMKSAGVAAVDLRLMWAGEHPGGEEILYPVAGAWIDFLIEREGRPNVLLLASDQTIESAARVYGSRFDELVVEFESSLND